MTPVAETNLVFESLAGGVTTDLVFGETGADPKDTVVTVLAEIPFQVSVKVSFLATVTVVANIPLPVHVNAQYISGASRPTVGDTAGRWQAGQVLKAPLVHRHTAALSRSEPARARWQRGQALHSPARILHQPAQALRSATTGPWQEGAPVRRQAVGRLQQGMPVRNDTGGSFQQGAPVRSSASARWQDGLRDRRPAVHGRWQEGHGGLGARYSEFARSGKHVSRSLGERHQQAMKPPPGIWDGTIIVPPEPPCYMPSPHLVFSAPWVASTHLVFACDGHGGEVPPPAVVVPVRRVYMIINDTSLWRVDGMLEVKGVSMSMSLDSDSWAWSFSASLPGASLALVQPDNSGERSNSRRASTGPRTGSSPSRSGGSARSNRRG